MKTKTHKTQDDLVKTISKIAKSMPLVRTVQLYQFALFLEKNPLPTEEKFEEIADDGAFWAKRFEASDSGRFDALIETIEREISEGKIFPMFDKNGEFLERK